MERIDRSRARSLRRSTAVIALLLAIAGGTASAAPPNVLWISAEDVSPNFGCYGDTYASTPHVDRLASEGAIFTRAFTPAGVCAVVRSGIITGVFPVSIGSHHMRSNIAPPPEVRCFTEYLRRAGYWCTNRSKTDYQFAPPLTAWDRQGARHDDWRGRAPGQPFFSVVNLTVSHESQVRHGDARHAEILSLLTPDQAHDPDAAGAHLPAYTPNTPATRRDWAWYSDNVSEMDRQAGEILARLDEDGLADDTVVFFWGDHGRGLPRGKRWIYDSGTLIPLVVRWPGTIAPGTKRDDLVSVLDFAPTLLALAGAEIPAHLHGRVFLGPRTAPEPEYLFFHRDRMDEAYELMRSARDRRYRYIRNFEPAKPYAQGIDYMDLMPTMQDWRRLHEEGRLPPEQSGWFALPKPVEELYDTEADPDEIRNLAGDPLHAERLRTMREAVEEWQIAVRDLGLVPEPVLMERMRPGAEMRPTPAPLLAFTASESAGATRVVVTPGEGQSVAYRVDGGDWRLWVEPFDVPSGSRVEVKACRLGWKDSEIVRGRSAAPAE